MTLSRITLLFALFTAAGSIQAASLKNASSVASELKGWSVTRTGEVSPDAVDEQDSLSGLSTEGALADSGQSEAAAPDDNAAARPRPALCADCRQLQPRFITGVRVISSSTNRKPDSNAGGAAGAGAAGAGAAGAGGSGGAGGGGAVTVLGGSGFAPPVFAAAAFAGGAPLAASSTVDAPVTSNPEPDTVVLLLGGLAVSAVSMSRRGRSKKHLQTE